MFNLKTLEHVLFWRSLLFWRDTQVDLVGGIGAMYISTMFMGAQTSSSVMPVLSNDKPAFYRERSSGLYAAIPYALAQVSLCKQVNAKLIFLCLFVITGVCTLMCFWHYLILQVVIEIPYVLAQVTIFEIISYGMIGFEWSALKFFQEYLFMLLSLLCFTYFGMMVSSMTPNQETCSILASLIFSLWNLFAGFAIPRNVSTSEI